MAATTRTLRRDTYPTAVGTPALWYDSTDCNVNNGNVQFLTDRSGNGKQATRAAAATGPTITDGGLNSQQVLTFTSGSSLKMNIASFAPGSANTILLVASKSAAANSYLLSGTGNNGIISNFSSVGFEWINGADRYTLSSAGTGSHILCVTQTDGGALSGYLDVATSIAADWNGGVAATATVALSGTSVTRLGCAANDTAFCTSNIRLLLWYNSVLSSGNLNLLFSYVKTLTGL